MAYKINIVTRLQHWMDSVPGQTFLNYAYSWGASIVILGALFKLTHLPGGNFMLFVGMGTEVVVFFISAFDRPFDKTEIGKELPHEYETDEQIAARLGLKDDEDEDEVDDTEESVAIGEGDETLEGDESESMESESEHIVRGTGSPVAAQGGAIGGGMVIIGGGVQATSTSAATPAATVQPQTAAPADDVNETVAAARAAINSLAPDGAKPFETEAKRLAEIIRLANDELLQRAQAALSPEMEQATQDYIEKLRTLAETFQKVDEQSARLSRDSEEMANLNRTLTAINKTYDLHFKSISQQVGTIEQINEQTRHLAAQIEELNGVYGRMIQALTVNMRMQQPVQPQQTYTQPQSGYAQPAPQQGYPQQGYAQQPPQPQQPAQGYPQP